MSNTLTLQDANGNDSWQFLVDANGRFSLSAMQAGAWTEFWSVERLTLADGENTLWSKIKQLCINWKSGIPFQRGLSIGCAPKTQSGTYGENYIKLFSDDLLEEYMQINIGMHGDASFSNRYAFFEAIEQHTGMLPINIQQPANQVPLTPTLLNGWVNYGSPCTTANYFKDSFGCVHVGGRVRNGSGVILTLPAGCRPTAEVKFLCAENNGVSVVKVTPDGNVSQVTGGNTELSLDGIAFSTH